MANYNFAHLASQVLYNFAALRSAGSVSPAAAYWATGTAGAFGPCTLTMQLVRSRPPAG